MIGGGELVAVVVGVVGRAIGADDLGDAISRVVGEAIVGEGCGTFLVLAGGEAAGEIEGVGGGGDELRAGEIGDSG